MQLVTKQVNVEEDGPALVGPLEATRRNQEGRDVEGPPPTPTQKRRILLRNGNPQGDPMNAPRCGAQTCRGTPCRAPAMANGRCRLHGGKSTGPRTAEGLARSRKAHYKHGRYSVESKARWKEAKKMMTEFAAYLKQVGGRPAPNDPFWIDLAAMLPSAFEQNPAGRSE